MLKKKLLFATNNNKKIIEAKSIFEPLNYQLYSLKEFGISTEIPEDFDSLDKNSAQKANFIYALTKTNCFADDSGLEIEALNGQPGAFSARYAGNSASDDENMQKVLSELKDQTNRKAQFRTVITLILEGQQFSFEGKIKGQICYTKQGTNGFGYDPVFMPLGHKNTFAEMPLEEKNKISHRAIALRKMHDFLIQLLN